MSAYEEGILRSLRRISRALDLYSRRLAGQVGLTAPQLICLRRIRDNGPMTPSHLARDVHLSQATVTGILDRLVAAGWVTRTRSMSDRRRVSVDLTPEGATLLSTAPSPLDSRFVERLVQLSADEQRAIHDSLEKVVSMMDAETLVSVGVGLGGSYGSPPSNGSFLAASSIAGDGEETEVSE